MLHVDHSRHAQSPGSSLPGTRVAAHGKRAAPLLARFLLTAQGAGASGLFSQPRVRHGAYYVPDRAQIPSAFQTRLRFLLRSRHSSDPKCVSDTDQVSSALQTQFRSQLPLSHRSDSSRILYTVKLDLNLSGTH